MPHDAANIVGPTLRPVTAIVDDLKKEAARWRSAITKTGVDGEALKLGRAKVELCERAATIISSMNEALAVARVGLDQIEPKSVLDAEIKRVSIAKIDWAIGCA